MATKIESGKSMRPAATGRLVPARRNARESIAQAERIAKGEAALVKLFGAFTVWMLLCEIGVL